MKIVISNSLGLPIYEQIKEQIKSAILGGDLKEGEAIPSIRLLARDLKISVITTTRAYTDLEQEGFIVNVQGKGCYVLPMNNDLVKEQLLRKIEDGLQSAVGAARIAKISRKELDAIWEQICEEEEYE